MEAISADNASVLTHTFLIVDKWFNFTSSFNFFEIYDLNLIIQLTQNHIIKNTVQFFFNNFSTRIVEACAICRLSKLKRFK